jgi:hypothetical protein
MTNAPIAPRDHMKPADVLRKEAAEERPDGADLLRPAEQLRSSEAFEAQASLLELFESLGVDLSKPDATVEIEPSAEALRAIGQLGNLLEGYAVDKEAYIAFDTGRGASERISTLAMWYLAQLGE